MVSTSDQCHFHNYYIPVGKIVLSLSKLIMAHPNLHIDLGKACPACDTFWAEFKSAVVDYTT